MNREREFRAGKRQSPKFGSIRIGEQAFVLAALQFFGTNPDQAQRFFGWSGLDAESLRPSAGEPGFVLGVLDYFAQNLASLERLGETAGFAPGDVIRLHETLKVRGLSSHDDI